MSENDCRYLKSVSASLKVYANDCLIYECGQENSYPDFMADPATTVTIVPLTGLTGTVSLRLEYRLPSSRSTLAVQPVLVGREAAHSLKRTAGYFVIGVCLGLIAPVSNEIEEAQRVYTLCASSVSVRGATTIG